MAANDVLAVPQWLEAHLGDRDVRVVEVDVSPAAYNDGHIPGSVLWNIYRDLKDADYHLVGDAAMLDLLARSGITQRSTVVLYGYGPALGFWLMKLVGHDDVRILDCSRATWMGDGRPWTTEVPVPTPGDYHAVDRDETIRADHRAVAAAIDDPSCLLLDVRSPAEYRGQRFWPSGGLEPGGRAGHVPSAVNLSIAAVQDESGAFRDPAQLRPIFAPVDLDGDDELITYCTIGGRAATAWFALTYLLDRKRVRVYDGSWAEWGRMPATPVTRHQTLPLAGARLAYDVVGTGPTVVLIHGFGLDMRMWEPQLDQLAQRFRVVAYDCRGFGASGPLDPTVPYTHAEDLLALLDHLGADTAALVGLSFGGRVALQTALAAPERIRALVLLDAVLDGVAWDDESSAALDQLAGAVARGGVAEGREAWLAHPLLAAARHHPELEERLAAMVADYPGQHWLGRDPHRPEPSPIASLPSVAVPTLVVVGALDVPCFRQMAGVLAAGIPGARYQQVPEAGHMVNMEQPAVVTALIEEFLG